MSGLTNVELRVLDAFPPPPEELTLEEAAQRCRPLAEVIVTGCVTRLLELDLLAVRLDLAGVTVVELPRWKLFLLSFLGRIGLSERTLLAVALTISGVTEWAARLRLTDEGLKRRFEERQGQPYGRPATGGTP